MNRGKQKFDVVGALGPLRRYALSLTRNRDAAEDLVHDTLVRAIERRDGFDDSRAVRPWLMSILHNRFLDISRRLSAERARDSELARGIELELHASQESSTRLADIARGFMALPEEQRSALHLVTVEGLSYEEAANILTIPVGTLVSRVSRARTRLRAFEDGSTEDNVVRLKTNGARDAS